MGIGPGQGQDQAPEGRRAGIGELAAQFGLTPRTIRFYEDQGLLAPVREHSQRVYGHRERVRLTLICRGKRLGFSLAEIKDFLKLYEVDDGQVEQMRYLIRRGRERIEALELQLRDVEDTLDDLRGIVGAAVGHLRRRGLDLALTE